MQIENVKNIGVIAHIDAGKTTLTERMLFYTQKIHRMGEVHNGTATMDYMPEEQERGITITAACTSCDWKNYHFNIIDTPGHVDFTIEVERSLRVLDGVVAVFCAVSGVEAQSETVWRQSEKFEVPKLIFINKIDRLGADFFRALEEVRERLETNAKAVTLPYTDKDGRETIVHLIEKTKLIFLEEDQGQTVETLPLSDEDELFILEHREALLESLAESDDIFFEQFLAGEYSQNDIIDALARATQSRVLIPVFAGSALKNMGVQPLLDAVGLYLPAPTEKKILARNPTTGQDVVLKADKDDKFCALVFKIAIQDGRKLSFLRIYSGKLEEGDTLCNVHSDTKDRVQQILKLHADRHEQYKEAYAGDIVGIIGLKNAHTGETYTHGDKILLEDLSMYQPVLTLALEPRNSEESQSVETALNRYCEEDPTLTYSIDEGSGHFIVSGMGELHLEILLEKLKREYKTDVRSGQPQVIFKEYITQKASGHGVFERELGTTQHYGEVRLTITPYPNEQHENIIRFSFDTEKYPQLYLDNALEATQSALLSSESGYALQDILVEIDCIEKKEHTSPAGIQMAVSMAMRDALSKAKLKKIEPIMKVEITSPEEFLGNSISVFSQRLGKVDNLLETAVANIKKVQGRAPLSQLFGFATDLRSATQGRAGLAMQFDSFDNFG